MDKEIKLVGAPSWYSTPLERLDFEWSREEELELERYCQRILKNIGNEDMTPTARLKATMSGSEKDRLLVEALYFNPYAVRTLDPDCGALKPGDVSMDPKLLVKAHLATVARFALDFPTFYPISYTPEFWGGRAEMTEYGNPRMIGDAPIKCVADLEGLAAPDPYQDGLFPGYLWACREIKRIFAKHGVGGVVPIWVSITDPLATVMESMTGWTKFIIGLRRDKELCQRAMDLATEWVIRIGQAMINMGAQCLMMCSYLGALPISGSEWVLEYYARIGRELGSQVPMWYGLTYEKAVDWFAAMYRSRAVGPGSFRGWFCVEMDCRQVVDFSREHALYCSCAPSDKVILNGPISVIEEQIKELCEYGKSYPRFAIGIAAVDYLTPQANFEDAIAAVKKYGKLA
jgi:uroporphyrinogen-III decarboxylase